MLEALETFESSHKGILHDIFCVGMGAGVAWQPPVRPPPDRRQGTFDQRSGSQLIAALGPFQYMKRRISQPIGFGKPAAILHNPITAETFLARFHTGTRDNEMAPTGGYRVHM